MSYGNSANLDQLVGQAYTQFQHGCTPSEPAQFQRVAWDAPPGGQGGRDASSTPTPPSEVRSRCIGACSKTRRSPAPRR